MRFARVVLGLSSLVWAGFGLMLSIWPERLDGVGLTVDSPLARIEVRGFYGGLELGIAAFLAWCAAAKSAERVRAGLVLTAAVLGGTAVGRLVGVALEGGSTTPQMWSFVALELTGTTLAVAALRGSGRGWNWLRRRRRRDRRRP